MSAGRSKLVVVLIVTIVGYTMWLASDRYIAAYLFLGLLSLAFRIAVYLAVLWLGVTVLGRLLPPRLRTPLTENRGQIVLAAAISLFFLHRIGLQVNHEWLPGRYHPVSLLGDVLLLALAGMIGWGLLFVRGARSIVFPAAALAIVLLSAGLDHLAAREQQRDRAGRGQARNTLALTTLPYVSFVPNDSKPSRTGVVYHNPELAYPGYNLAVAVSSARALLLDMDGNVVHEWTTDVDPGYAWEFVSLCRNGDLLVSIQNRKLVRLDWNGAVKWVKKLRCHHDLDVAENGDITVLTRRDRFVAVHGFPVPVRDDYAVTLSSDGEIKHEYSLGEAMRDFVPISRVFRIYRWQLTSFRFSIRYRTRDQFMFGKGFVDILHANTVRFVDRDVSDELRKGYVIACAPEIDVVAVIDPETGMPMWNWGRGVIEKPHNPTLLENGHILVFDNGTRRKYSRILEIDPSSGEIVWRYAYDPRSVFYSPVCGAAQRLPNGNTMITDTTGGRVFEVTMDGDIVWDFLTPLPTDESETRPTIYRMERITRDEYPSLPAL